MNVSDYIRQLFLDFGVRLSNASVLRISLKSGSSPDDVLGADNMEDIDKAVVKFLPSLLLFPQSVREGGMSISRSQIDDIKAYYHLKCKEYGIKDELSNRPKTKFL